MKEPYLLCSSTSTATELCLRAEGATLLRASLPPPAAPHAWWRAAPMLCDALSLWLGQPLSIVLAADEPDGVSGLGLCDEFGFGVRTERFAVEVVPAAPLAAPPPQPALRTEPTAESSTDPPFDPRQLALRGIR